MEPVEKLIREEGNFVILLPVGEGEILVCPSCPGRGRYAGARRIENACRHIREHHAECAVVFRCWGCGFVAPPTARYPRKVVTAHAAAECGLGIPAPAAAAVNSPPATRRNNIRRRLRIGTPEPTTPARPRQNTSQTAVPSPIPTLETPQQRNTEAAALDSSSEEVFLSPQTSPQAQVPVAATIVSSPQQSTQAEGGQTRLSPPTPLPALSNSLPQPSSIPDPRPHAVQGVPPRQPAERPSSRRNPTTEQRRLMDLLEAVTTGEQLNTLAPQVARFLGRLSGRDTPRLQNSRPQHRGVARSASRAPDRIREATRIQRLYRNNKKRAVQEVVEGPNRTCAIDLHTIERHFAALGACRDGGAEWPDVFSEKAPAAASNDSLEDPFTREEILGKLRGRNNTAPGPDGVKYAELRKADPGAYVLAALYNAVWRTESVPSSWKESNTILLYKKGEVADIDNWRPISLGDTCPKLFAAVLADRVKRWAVTNQRFSPSQKGFLEFDGCFEHNFVLQEIIQDASSSGKEVVVAWVDLAAAFTSVPHSSILRALEGHGMPSKPRQVIASMYDGMNTRVRTAEGLTNPILMQSGVRQGCPLSPDVFNLTLEVVIRAASRTGLGYDISGQQINNLAYADDVTFLADSPEAMRRILEAAEIAAGAVGLSFKPAKCATLHLIGNAVQETIFNIQGSPVRALSLGDAYEHLGIPTGYQVKQTPVNTIAGLLADTREVHSSLLAPWQKLDAVATFLLPRLDFLMQGADIEKDHLTEADKNIRRLAKTWLALPQRASAELVYLPPSKGGGGLLPLGDLYDLLTVVHAYKMLYASDDLVSRLADSMLRKTVAGRLRKREASRVEIARYLSGDLELPRAVTKGSYWTRVRNAVRRSQGKLRLRWIWHQEAGEFHLRVGDGDRASVYTPRNRQNIASLLRRKLVEYYEGTLLAKPDQGKVFEVTRRSRVSNHFLRTGKNTRFCDWRFIHRARLGVLPLNATMRWRTGGDKRCRRCGHDLETVPHVLNHCGVHTAARQLRHNNVQNRLAKAASRCRGTIRVNRTIEGAPEELAQLRPDIVLRDDISRRVVIIDVAIPFENRLADFELARQRKISKYQPLADHLTSLGYSVETDAFLVGALGGWDNHNERTMRLLNISPYYARMMRRFMVSDTIRWSRDIYVEHVSGIRQYRELDTP